MGADISTAQPIESPGLKALAIPPRLAGNPSSAPQFPTTVRSVDGGEVIGGDPRATRALVALMNVHAVNGGAACHWGGPAAFAEIMAAIHGIMFRTEDRPWYEAFNFVNDAGHTENGIYALRANLGFDNMTLEDLRGFRSISSKLTGHGESHLNPEGMLLSNGPLSSTVAQAQGLAIGDRAAGRDRVTVLTVSDGASMEGEAKEAFAAIPGLAAKDLVNPFILVISDNNTKLSGRINDDAFCMQPSFDAMDDLGWDVISVGNGHDLQAVFTALEKGIAAAKETPTKPVCLLVKTIKGFGVKATEESASGGHGFPLKGGEKIVEFVSEIWSGNVPKALTEWANELRQQWEAHQAAKAGSGAAPAAVKKSKIQAGLAVGAINAAKEGYPVYSVSSDVQGSTGISAFQKSFPDRFVEVGIAEANMVSVGAGLAKAGFIPIVDTFGQFGATKGNLPLTMAALSQAPVIAIFSHVGFQDAADGASHQATTYFAATSAIPHTAVVAPSCSDEAEALMYQAIQRYAAARSARQDGETTIFFVGRENYPIYWVENAQYEWGKAQVISAGSDVTLIGSGPLFSKAQQAAALLGEERILATVINNPFVNQVDIATIGPAVSNTGGRVVTIEDHQIIGGMGAQVSHALSRNGIAHQVRSLGIDGEFGQSAYLAEHLYEKHGLTGPAMAKAAKELLGKA
ncbi:MAG: Transketolase [Verrucomicrobia subdivision 3 bacterium]|nr:Transketolase [Limisphaerales bacterium]MCS1413023.1 Transketolase [Limisphaerales bacterium]